MPIELSGNVKVDNSAATLVLGGIISGSTGLTKDGAGTLDVTASQHLYGHDDDRRWHPSGRRFSRGEPRDGQFRYDPGWNRDGRLDHGQWSDSQSGRRGSRHAVDTGDLTLGADSSSNNSTYSVVIDGDSTGDYSQTQVAGAINLTGSTLNVTLGPGFTATIPSSFTIIDNTGSAAVNGVFNGLTEGSTIDVDGTTFDITYAGGANGKSVVLTAVYPSTTTLTSFPTSPTSGQSVTFTATVTGPTGSPTPTGTVDFYSGTTLLGPGTLDANGVATFSTTTLTAGATPSPRNTQLTALFHRATLRRSR